MDRWKPPKDLIPFKTVPQMLIIVIHLCGYTLWGLDYSHALFIKPTGGRFDSMRYGALGTAFWRNVSHNLGRALHHWLWAPVVGPLSPFWLWFILFGPLCLGLTVWFLLNDQEVDPEKIGSLRVSLDRVGKMKAKVARQPGNFLGASMSARNRAVILPEAWRTSHAYCVGASRSGKTVSVMLPLALRDIERGHPVIFFDGKGDLEHLHALAAQAQKCGRGDDFMLFSLNDPARSRTYNPLAFGNATQKKDKLIGAFTWTEEHYKKVSEDTLLTVINALEGTGQRYNLEDLYLCLTEPKAVHRVYELCENPGAKEHLEHFFNKFADTTRDITGLIKDLGLIVKNDFWPLMDTFCPEIDFLDVIQNRKILYLVFNTQAYQDTAERLARLFLQDLRAASDYIQNKMKRTDRTFTPIFVDEFNCFAFDAFGDFMSKCGGAGFALTLAHQSLGQLNKRGDYFKDEILDNANIKIIMRQDSPDAIDEFTRMIGTHTRTEYTDQTEDVLLAGRMATGVGTAKSVEAFNISPNRIRQLQPHQAALLIKQPFQYDLLQLDRVVAVHDQHVLERLPQRSTFPRGNGIDLRRYLREMKGKK
ncbi:MAG: type IV secretory system conjugative DNA transfer family protein [Elusimicrobia bacterium]|nr:type IV secretory system conjugative DNA transfer family protein [Elusimicrobiota bacterium]